MESSIHVDDSGSEALREIVQKFRRLQAILINLSARADSARELAVDLEEKLNWFIAGPANPEKPRVNGTIPGSSESTSRSLSICRVW
jgi:hypothetical protein